MKIKNKEEETYIPPQAIEEEFNVEDHVDKDILDLHELLVETYQDSAPLLSVLEAWKNKHKRLFISKISSDSPDYYIFTSIKRSEFKKYQAQGVFENEEKGNEVLVETCLLFPAATTQWRLTCDAGIITTLGKQIAYKSGFVSQQEALSLIKII